MKKFQDIYNNENNKHFEKIVFISDTPVFGVVAGNNTEIRDLLSTKELLGLMKASIPAEDLKGIGWGKKIEYKNEDYEFLVELTSDKQVRVEIVKLEQEEKEEPKEVIQKIQKKEIDPKIIDDLLTADALVYFSGEEPSKLTQIIANSGYTLKSSNDPYAIIQTINYKAFPLLALFVEDNLAENPVLSELKNMHMDVRRSQFTLLVSDNVKTGDSELAFSYSVSMVLNSSDIDQFESLFTKTTESLKRTNSAFIDIIENKA